MIPRNELKRVLASTTLKQGAGCLKKGDCYCALGVGVQAVIDGDILIDGQKNPDGWHWHLPPDTVRAIVVNRFQFRVRYDAIFERYEKVINMNDSDHLTFKEIAEKL